MNFLIYLLSYLILSGGAFASATKNSTNFNLCLEPIMGLTLPEDSMMLGVVEAKHLSYVNYAGLVSKRGFITLEDAQKYLIGTQQEMNAILNVIRNMDKKHSDKQHYSSPYTKARREAEKTVKENLLRIYSNYIYLNQTIRENIRTQEEIDVLDIERNLDKEFGIELTTLVKKKH